MLWRPKTLTAQLAIALFFVVLFLSTAQYFSLSRFWFYSVNRFEQEVNWGLADDLAEKIEPTLVKPIDSDALARLFDQLRRFNWRIELFVLDAQGDILVDNRGQIRGKNNPIDSLTGRNSISLDPIKQFLADTKNRTIPIYGDCPIRHPGSACSTIFSVTPIRFQGSLGYLYVVLQGSSYKHILRAAEDIYLTAGGTLISAIVLVASLLLGFALFYLLTKRFRLLQAAVERFEQGDLEARAPEHGKDEVAQLGGSVNRMIQTIRDTIAALQKTDIFRREMVASISHDLGGPLAATQLSIERVLRKEDASKEERRESLETAINNVLLLNRLVDSLFELSKLDAVDAKADCEIFSATELISEEILPQLQPHATEKAIELAVEFPDKDLFVNADADLLGRALYNLVENAIKYTDSGGSVAVSLEENDRMVRFAVRDNGLGIPAEKIERIFDRFYQGDHSRPKESGSAGLGLAIVKRVCDLHDATISVESELGAGSCFSFELPAAEYPLRDESADGEDRRK